MMRVVMYARKWFEDVSVDVRTSVDGNVEIWLAKSVMPANHLEDKSTAMDSH